MQMSTEKKETSEIKTALVSRGRLFREGLSSGLGGTRFVVSHRAERVNELGDATGSANAPAIVLLEELESTEDTIAAIEVLGTRHPDVPVVILSGVWEPSCLASYLRQGAKAYLMKDISLEALLQSLELVMLGELVLPSQLASHLVNHGMNGCMINANLAQDHGLSEREQQILRCLLNGESNKAIARRLNIADATVKVHMKTLLRKVNVENRTQAAIWALNHGVASETEQAQHPH
jgi:two-component system nitrate/nitrite response regulator NarL